MVFSTILLLYNNNITCSGFILARTKHSRLLLGTEMLAFLTYPVMSLQYPVPIKLLGEFSLISFVLKALNFSSAMNRVVSNTN